MLTGTQILIMVIAVTLGTMVTRFTPFILFPEHKEPPKVISYLSNVLPPAMIGLLVVYCLKDVSIVSGNHGAPELISILGIIILQRWTHNVLLSIGAGSICYMFLIQNVF